MLLNFFPVLISKKHEEPLGMVQAEMKKKTLCFEEITG